MFLHIVINTGTTEHTKLALNSEKVDLLLKHILQRDGYTREHSLTRP